MIEHFHKTYKTTIRLDGTTESYDLEKPIIPIPIDKKMIHNISLESLESIARKHFS